MNATLESLAARLDRATTAKEVFGKFAGEEGLSQAYHRLARMAHPDAYTTAGDRSLAQRVFIRLGEWLARAKADLSPDAGEAGTPWDGYSIPLNSPRRAYMVSSAFTEEGPYLCYPCRFQEGEQTVQAELKIARDPRSNPLAQNEATSLRLLRQEGKEDRFAAYFPRLVDTFLIVDGGIQRQANVLESGRGWYTLADVSVDYPHGIDAKDMAWIWRRLLVALGAAHTKGIIHGAVLPENVSILPAEHGLRLDNWEFSARPAEGGFVTGIDARRYSWYPEELLSESIPTPGADLFLAARCMISLLGGDPIKNSDLPAPKAIQYFLKGCTLASTRTRPQDAWALKEEFDDVIERLWGKRAFHPFYMKSQPKNP